MLIPKYGVHFSRGERCIYVSVNALSCSQEEFLNLKFEHLKSVGELKIEGLLIVLESESIVGLSAEEWLLSDVPNATYNHLENGWRLAISVASTKPDNTCHIISALN